MTTKIDKPVRRATGISIQDREIVAGLEFVDGSPCLTIKQKGFRSGWYVKIENVALFAMTQYPRTNKDQELVIKNDKQVLEKWKHELGTTTVG